LRERIPARYWVRLDQLGIKGVGLTGCSAHELLSAPRSFSSWVSPEFLIHKSLE